MREVDKFSESGFDVAIVEATSAPIYKPKFYMDMLVKNTQKSLGTIQFERWKVPIGSVPNDFPLEDVDSILNSLNTYLITSGYSKVSRESIQRVINSIIIDQILCK